MAKNGLAYMIVGNKGRWKQVVGMDFTCGSTDPAKLRDRMLEVFQYADEAGLNANLAASDFGSNNLGL